MKVKEAAASFLYDTKNTDILKSLYEFREGVPFEKKIKLSYLDKLRLYNNEKVIIKKLKKVKPTRITLETQVIGLDDTYKVVYLFYKKKQNNHWYIYDVELVGVSIIQTYRKQFSEFLKTKSVNQLIKSL